MKEITLRVEGMVCSGCENRIKNALGNINEVESVSASHEEGLVTVNFNAEIDENIIVKKIEDLGFEIIKED